MTWSTHITCCSVSLTGCTSTQRWAGVWTSSTPRSLVSSYASPSSFPSSFPSLSPVVIPFAPSRRHSLRSLPSSFPSLPPLLISLFPSLLIPLFPSLLIPLIPLLHSLFPSLLPYHLYQQLYFYQNLPDRHVVVSLGVSGTAKVPCIIDILCKDHDGIEVEAKGIKEHYFKNYVRQLVERSHLRGSMNGDTLQGVLDINYFDENGYALHHQSTALRSCPLM